MPVDAAFFAELGSYLPYERPSGLNTAECFVVLRGPSAGAPVTEAGLRSLFRRHRSSSGALRVLSRGSCDRGVTQPPRSPGVRTVG